MENKDSAVETGTQMIKVLFGAHPASIRSVNNEGYMPLHTLCRNKKEATAMQILKFFLEKNPEAVRHATTRGYLPIHFAVGTKSPEFCRVLIEAYPGSNPNPNYDTSSPCMFKRFFSYGRIFVQAFYR